ncbi:unnamed protein product [Prunus armeniaca]
MRCTFPSGWLDWGSRRLSSLCIFTQSLSNREVLARYRTIAERQKRGVISLVGCLLLRNPGGTCGVWPTVIGSVCPGRPPISKENEDEVDRVRSLLSETEQEYRHLVTPKNLLESELLQGSVVKGRTKVVVDIDEAKMQKQLRESRAKKAEKGGCQAGDW